MEGIQEGAKILQLRGKGMTNKEHFKRRSMEFLLMYLSGDQILYKSEREDENSITYMRISSTPHPTSN